MGCKPENWPHCKCTPKFQNNGMVNISRLRERGICFHICKFFQHLRAGHFNFCLFCVFVYVGWLDHANPHRVFLFDLSYKLHSKDNMAHSFLLCVCFYQDNNTKCNVIGGLSPRSTNEWVSSLRSQLNSWRFRGLQPQPLASDITNTN